MRKLFSIVAVAAALSHHGQKLPFSDAGKWGVREGNEVLVPAVYDTVFGYDPTGRVCLACQRIVNVNAGGFIKVTTTSFRCHYLDTGNRRLNVRNALGDTSSIFSLRRKSVEHYHHHGDAMTVSTGGVRHLVGKDFKQLTFKGYHHVEKVPGADFYICEQQSESETIYAGVVSQHEKQIIPFRYASIRVNAADSLIIACSAGFRGTDDLYDFDGRKLAGTRRHIVHATRNFVVEKHTDLPRQYYLVSRTQEKETGFEADDVAVTDEGEIHIRRKRTWFVLDAATGEKTPIKNSLYEKDQGSN